MNSGNDRGSSTTASREERLKQALRANLRRRKDQAKERRAGASDTESAEDKA